MKIYNRSYNFEWNYFAIRRGLLASLFIAAAVLFETGCTTNAPLINRTAPLVSINADGNTIPVSATP